MLTLNRKRNTYPLRMEGMRKGLIQREIGVGVGGAGSRGRPAELPESGSPSQPGKDSAHSSPEQKESGLG